MAPYAPAKVLVVAGVDHVRKAAHNYMPVSRMTRGGGDLEPGRCAISPGRRNCSAACSDPRLLFSSTSTLANCVVLATAALFVQSEYPATEISSAREGDQASGAPGCGRI